MPPNPHSPPDQTCAFVRSVLGTTGTWADVSWDHAESAVWRVECDDRTVYVKRHISPRKFEREREAYRHWVFPAFGKAAPELIASDEQHLLLSALPGRMAEAETLESVHFETAGRLLRQLHDLPFADEDLVPLSRAVRMRVNEWLERAAKMNSKGPSLNTFEFLPIDVIRNRVEAAAAALADTTRVPCHRDFTPRNWIIDGDRLGVIDFEHSRADVRLMGFAKLRCGLWIDHPETEAAFWRGYGEPTEAERGLIDDLALLESLGTIVWAREHSDTDFEERGRRAMRDLLGSPKHQSAQYGLQYSLKIPAKKK